MSDVRILNLPKIVDRRGNLSFLEAEKTVPFNISRVYWIYDIPGGQKRKSRAYIEQQEIIIALSGSFDVTTDDGKNKQRYTLNRSYEALYIPNGVWHNIENFSTNSICLVLSSTSYDENDYIRNYKDYKKTLKSSAFKNIIIPDGEVASPKQSETYSTVYDCSLLEFPVRKDRTGTITPIHSADTVPFPIRRVFYIYDIPSGESRGMHAHKRCHEVLVATSGSFEVELDDGTNKRIITLNKPMYGLHIPPGVWATEKEYSSGVTCLALASDIYDERDYIKSYSDFKKYRSECQ